MCVGFLANILEACVEFVCCFACFLCCYKTSTTQDVNQGTLSFSLFLC